MIKRFKKLIKNPKKGMSLVVVMISIAMLVVMGTLFTSVALRSYNYSYSKICKQQARYTAESSVNALYDLIYDDEEAMNIIIETLDAKYEEAKLSGVTDVTAVYCTIGEVGGSGNVIAGDTGPTIIQDAGLFKDVMGTCTLRARYNNDQRSQLSLEATATYKGYTDSIRMKIAKTTKAAQELAKIFSNAFCWSSPITALVAAECIGDIYVAQPIVYIYDDNGELKTTGNEGVYNRVLGLLESTGSYGGYVGTAGQYIRDVNDAIINDASDMGIYNRMLRDTVYDNIDTVTGMDSEGEPISLQGNTKPFDIDNTPLAVAGTTLSNPNYYSNYAEVQTSFPADWVELFLFSDYRTDSVAYTDIKTEDKNSSYNYFTHNGSSYTNVANSFPNDYLAGNIAYPRNFTAVNGNLYVQSRALIGLWDRNNSDRANWRYYSDDLYTVTYQSYRWDSNNGEWNRFEHGYPGWDGGGEDVFFDHVNDQIPAEMTTFRLNGNMYLWDDTRIENFDSINTYNAYQGIKNNIYAKKDLVIDGFIYVNGSMLETQSKNSVNIFGDVMVQGDLYISNATIYGDVYCNGDNLTIIDSEIYGNVYLRGNNLVTHNVVIANGGSSSDDKYYFADGNGLYISNPGGNVVVAGLQSDCRTETNDSCISYINTNAIGAHLRNTVVEGTFYSRVNTKIVSAMTPRAVADGVGISGYYSTIKGVKNVRSQYGNIFVEEYLDINLRYDGSDYLSGGGGDGEIALRDNIITVTGTLVANGLRLMQSQHRTNAWSGLYPPILNFNNIFVGTGSYYIDGNNKVGDFVGSSDYKSIAIQSFYCPLLGSIWDYTINNRPLVPTILGTWMQGTMGVNYSGSVISQAADALFASMTSRFATYGSATENIRFGGGQELNLWADYFFPKDWEEKEVSTLKWSAPKAADSEETVINVYYFDMTTYDQSANLVDVFNTYLAITGRNDVCSVDTVNKVIEIKKSMVFDGKVSVPNGYTLKFNTYESNLHIKFDGGLTVGSNAKVMLTGGNMTFAYIGGSDSPQLDFGSNSVVGIVEEMIGVEQRSDSIYFISYDDIIINLGYDMILNGYVYAPNGFVNVVGSSGNESLLNGCIAVKNYVMTGETGENLSEYRNTITRYTMCVYNHIAPPLITDISFEYGGSEADIGLFGEIVWEFLGYY